MTILQKEEEGLRIIAPGTDPVADVVLIHGLQGHPRTTWLYGADTDASKKSGTGFLKSFKHKLSSDKAQSAQKSKFFWPGEALAQDFPNLRIAAYGYDSRVSHFFSGSSSQVTIVGHGRSLLNELESFRRGVAADRPILFIAHSLGGLVLKEALRRTYKAETYEPEFRAIYNATRAILFLGTPHSGSQFADWGLIARNVASTVGFDASNSVLRDLQVDASILDSLRDDFSRLLREESFWVFTFMEEKGFKGIRGLNDKIVPDASATLGYARERKYYINANHVEMCRFCGNAEKDNGYRQVKDAIAKSLEGPPPVALRSETAPQRPRISIQNQILKILKVDSSYSLRYEQVEIAFGGSFHWLFTREELGFERWLREGGLYWIRGLPATGKSTLMKMAYNNERTKRNMQESSRKQITAEFFFHDRGSEKQKSFMGLIHAILYQVLSTEPALLVCVEPCFDAHFGSELMTEPAKISPLVDYNLLWTSFQQLLQQKRITVDIYLFLDALDEYSGTKVEIAEFVKTIASESSKTTSGTKIHVCFSSRPENDLLDHFEPLNLPGFDIKDHTTQDIEIVAQATMESNHRMFSSLNSDRNEEKYKATELYETLCAKASGVFLWVRLVLQDLLQEYTDGKSLDGLLELLAILPSDLEQYYTERVVDRIRVQYRDDALTMIDIVRCAPQPLTVSVFYRVFLNAHKLDLSYLTEAAESYTEITRSLDRLLRSRSGGLIEIVNTIHFGTPTTHIQFIHLTVKTWVAKAKTRERISRDLALLSTGYEYYSRFCVSILNSWSLDNKGPVHEEFQMHTALPEESFLEHCANAEQETGIAQTAILTQVEDLAIQSFYDSSMWRGEMSREVITNLLSFAVAAQLEKFLQEYVAMQSLPIGVLTSALRLAVKLTNSYRIRSHNPTRRARIIQLLLSLGADLNARERGLTVFQQLWIRHDSCRQPDAQMAKMMVEHGQKPEVDLPYTERMARRVYVTRRSTPLHMACRRAELETAQSLIRHGASVCAVDSQLQTPLDRATRHLGARIYTYLEHQKEAIAEEPSTVSTAPLETATDLQARLTCISMLLTAGARLSYDSDKDESIYDDYHFYDRVVITRAHIDALQEQGFDVDSRILDLPKHSQSLAGMVGEQLSVMRKWLPIGR